MRQVIILLVACLFSSPNVFAKNNVTICMDKGFWYPFTFVKNGKPSGMHIDIIAEALDRLGYTATFIPLPWKRCLLEAKSGNVDGIATASYKDERAVFLAYPSDAASVKKSNWRVMQVEYVVVTTVQNEYEYDGDILTIPTPILAPRGYSIAEDLKKKGLNVDDSAPGDINNFKKLVRSGKGSMVSIPGVINLLSKNPEYRGKLKINKKPIKSKSYFFALSKKSKISERERKEIWDKIVDVRDDIVFMAEVTTKY